MRGREVDDDFGDGRAEPEFGDPENGVEAGEEGGGDGEIEEEGPGALDGELFGEGETRPHLAGSGAGIPDLLMLVLGKHEAAAGVVPVKELGVAAPGDGGFELAAAFVVAELLVEHVEEEFLGNGVVGLVGERAGDLAEQQDVIDGGLAEELFLPEDLGFGVGAAFRGDGGVALLHREEAEQLRGFDDGEEIVDLEGELVGEAVDVGASAEDR